MRAWTLVLLALVAVDLSAQDQTALTKSERLLTDMPTVTEVVGDATEGLRPDYSREALLSAVWTDPYFDEDDVPRAPKTFDPLEFTVLGQSFRFMPFLGSTSGSSASPFDVVDPFTIAPVSAAYTPKTFRDRWREWRLKRETEKQ